MALYLMLNAFHATTSMCMKSDVRDMIICLQNGHKGLLKEMEELLHQLHSDAKETQTSQQLSHKAAGMNLNESFTDDLDNMEGIMPRKPIIE